MRVSSLSDDRIISLVSRYFVPVWLSRDRYQMGKANRAEEALVARIDASRQRQRFEGGSVCVYITAADGEVLATLPVQKASKPELLVPFLRKVVDAEKLAPRKPAAVKAAPRPEAPKPAGKDSLRFTIRARFDDPGPNRGTSRDVVELARTEWSSFVAPAGARVGRSWQIPRAVAEKLLRQGYPPLPFWDAKLAKVTTCELTATVSKVTGDTVRLRLTGKLELIYPNRGEPTDGRATARLVGFARYDSAKNALTALALTSDGARYVWRWQGKPQPRDMSLSVELGP
jgi:hypothetical protein